MKDSIVEKLNNLTERHQELEGLMSEPDVISDQNQFRELSQEYAQLEPVVKCFGEYKTVQGDLESAEEMLKESDAELREMAIEEKKIATARTEELELELQRLL